MRGTASGGREPKAKPGAKAPASTERSEGARREDYGWGWAGGVTKLTLALALTPTLTLTLTPTLSLALALRVATRGSSLVAASLSPAWVVGCSRGWPCGPAPRLG
jgi:hypothetical protein